MTLDSRIEKINAELKELRERSKTLAAELVELELERADAFPVGAVIRWPRGKGEQFGRVVARDWWMRTAEYTVVTLKRDGKEGVQVRVPWYQGVRLVDETYDKTRNYALAATTESNEKRDLKTLADGINAHLRRLEAEGKEKSGLSLYHAAARQRGAYVSVIYISYQNSTTLTRDEAGAYLDWLDAGNKGRHFEAERELKNGKRA